MISLFEGNTPVRALESRTNPLNNPTLSLSEALMQIGMGAPTASGQDISERSALQQVWVYACVRVLAESVGSLPAKLYELTQAGRKEAVNHDLYFLLTVEPNPEMSSVTFFETLTGCMVLTGNAYAQIARDRDGSPAGLYPLHPLLTSAVRVTPAQAAEINGFANGPTIAYRTTDGSPTGRLVAAADILHFPLFGWDGLKGLSPIQQARQTIGLAKAAEEYGAGFFGSGARPSAILTAAGVNDIEMAKFRERWNQRNSGGKQGRTEVMPGTWDYKKISVDPEEAQFLATRKMAREDIAGLFRVPPHMVGDTSRLSNSNHEQQSLEFVTDSLRPVLSRIEAECSRKLLPRLGRKAGLLVIEFDVRERLRGDFQTTAQGLAFGRQWGFLTANDCRLELGMNPLGPEGDVLMYPLNMGNAEALTHSDAKLPLVTAKAQLGVPAKIGGLVSDDDSPDDQARSLLQRRSSTWIPLLRDGVGRLSARDKRDSAAVSRIFTPIIEAIVSDAKVAAELCYGLEAHWESDTTALREAQISAITRRAEKWALESADMNAMLELRKASEYLVTPIFRHAALVKETTNAEKD